MGVSSFECFFSPLKLKESLTHTHTPLGMCTIVVQYCATNDQFANDQVVCSETNTCTSDDRSQQEPGSCLGMGERCVTRFRVSNCSPETRGIGGFCSSNTIDTE